MKASSFTHELAKTSAVFGRKSDAKVVFTGDGAATDGNIIKLPSIDHNADVTEEQAAIMRGYVDHEAGHVRHTDFTVLRKHKDELSKNKLLHSCANALEDIWLEQRVRAEYPGASDNIKATADAVNREFLDNVKADDERLRDPVWIGPVAATWIGRTEYVPETTKQCIDMLDDELREQITDIVTRVDGCRNSHEIFDLAREFEGAMRKGREDREIDKPETPEGAPSDERGDGSMGESTSSKRQQHMRTSKMEAQAKQGTLTVTWMTDHGVRMRLTKTGPTSQRDQLMQTALVTVRNSMMTETCPHMSMTWFTKTLT